MSDFTQCRNLVFGSPEWLAAITALPNPDEPLSHIAVTFVGAPGGDLTVCLCSGPGGTGVELGHDGELSVTIPCDAAEALLVEGNKAPAIAAWYAGDIALSGNVGLLMRAG